MAKKHRFKTEAAFYAVSLLVVFALLVCDTAAGLASGLTRGLAFAATAVLCALAKILGVQSLDVLHIEILQINSFY